MVVKVTVRVTQDEAKELTYQNVEDVGIVQPGCYMLSNAEGKLIAHIPVNHVIALEIPAHDTSLVVASSLLTK